MIKKMSALLLAVIMALSFAACSAAPNKEELGGNKPSDGGFSGGGNQNAPSYGTPGDEIQGDNDFEAKPEGGNSGNEDVTVGAGEEADPPQETSPTVRPVETESQNPNPGEIDPEGSETSDEDETTEPVEGTSEAETVPPTLPIPTVSDLMTNSFINASQFPLSTFSADVDTASYTYFRKLVNSGYGFDALRASGSNFRIEEFINYFKYDVEQPKEGELFGVKTEIVPCPWNAENMLFRVTLQAEDAAPTAGNNLVFLIDVSGSMSGQDKLPLLKRAFSYLVGNLGANDTVSIVTYSGKEAVVLDGCNGLEGTDIMNSINALKASGSTNGEAGLTMAYQLAEAHYIEGGNNRIIMASDGDLNVGMTSTQELTNYIAGKRDQGVYLSVLGFGTGNYRDEKMEALADNGNGIYYYIDGEAEAEKVFGTDLVGTLYTVANDVKLQVEFDPQLVEEYRLIGYENRKLEADDFDNDRKDAGEVGASHQITVVYEIKPGQQTPGNDNDPITLRVRYKEPGQTLSLLNEYVIEGFWNPQAPSEDMKFITAVIETAALLRNSKYDGEITIESISAQLEALTLNDSYKEEFREIVKTLCDTVKK